LARTKNDRIAAIELEMEQLANQRKELLQKQKEADRKSRTSRLCKRGGLLESMLPDTITLTVENFKLFLEMTIASSEGKELLADLLAEQDKQTAAANSAVTAAQSGENATDNGAVTSTDNGASPADKLAVTATQSGENTAANNAITATRNDTITAATASAVPATRNDTTATTKFPETAVNVSTTAPTKPTNTPQSVSATRNANAGNK
jgi:hypothetical protein